MITRLQSGAAGETVPAAPSASVVLLRDHDHGLETYVLHRHTTMAFAAGMVVFPGGRVEPVDRADQTPGHQEVDHQVDPEFDHEAVYRRCAVRETEEETGVRLRAVDLVPWAYWITPEIEPRRYRTRFYLAALPAGQQAADVSGEAWLAEWRSPADLLRAADVGELALMPPTRSVLIELADQQSVASVLSAGDGRSIDAVLPEPRPGPDGWAFVYQEGP